MMSWFSWLGGGKTIEKGIDVIDKAFYTEEEKAEQKSKLLDDFRPFKLVQRHLAKEVMFMFKVLLAIEVPLVIASVKYEVAGKALIALNSLEAVQILGWSYLAVMALYFTGGVISTPLSMFGKK